MELGVQQNAGRRQLEKAIRVMTEIEKIGISAMAFLNVVLSLT